MCGQDWILGRDGTIALARNDGVEWLLCLSPGDRKRTPQRPRNGHRVVCMPRRHISCGHPISWFPHCVLPDTHPPGQLLVAVSHTGTHFGLVLSKKSADTMDLHLWELNHHSWHWQVFQFTSSPMGNSEHIPGTPHRDVGIPTPGNTVDSLDRHGGYVFTNASCRPSLSLTAPGLVPPLPPSQHTGVRFGSEAHAMLSDGSPLAPSSTSAVRQESDPSVHSPGSQLASVLPMAAAHMVRATHEPPVPTPAWAALNAPSMAHPRTPPEASPRWIRAWSSVDQRPYFYHRQTGVISWELGDGDFMDDPGFLEESNRDREEFDC